MPLKQKERKQLMILGGLVGVILIALAFFYRDKLLPQPQSGATSYVSSQRITLPTAEAAQGLFKRADYMNLKQFGVVPVKAPPAGMTNPFK